MNTHPFASPYLKTVFILLAFLVTAGVLQAQTMDYDLNQANRTIKAIDGDLKRLKQGDVAAYNRISKKMGKAAKHLQATQSRDHADFEPLVRRWQKYQGQMESIAREWNAAAASQQAELAKQKRLQAAEAEKQAQAADLAKQQAIKARQQQAAEAEKKSQAATLARQKAAATGERVGAAENQSQGTAGEKPKVKRVNLDPLMAKYQNSSLPKLAETPDLDQAKAWAEQMHALQTTIKQADLATVDAALKSGAASQNDAGRVRYWISEGFQDSIKRQVQLEVSKRTGMVKGMVYSKDLILSIPDDDANGAYRVAGPIHGPGNKQRLDAAIESAAVVAVFDQVFGTNNTETAALLPQLKKARARVDELEPLAKKQEKILAKAPRREKESKKDFLAAMAQKFWLDGSVLAETEADGSIWIDANDVGDITANGEIWVNANLRGSIEPNGEVWFDSNQVGSLETNGEVWRDSNQVGLIDKQGTVWVNNNPSGEIEPYKGVWRRAAILYYFGDYFR